jgi:hemolysin activation/secretion protein
MPCCPDNGAFASIELRIPVWRSPRIVALLQITPFLDVRTGWNLSARPDPDPNTLFSAGLGLRLQLSDRLTARFVWGIPLRSFPGERRTLQENGIYFSVIANPF